MLQSLFVYPLLILVMLYFAYVGRAKESWKYMVYGCVAYAVVFGMRYGVGVDYLAYKESYEVLAGHYGETEHVMKLETGFRLFTQALAQSGIHYAVYFGIIALAQLLLTFWAFKDKPQSYPYLVFTFMVSCTMWLTYSNGLRQILVVNLWILALRFATERRPWCFYVTVLSGLLFHNSAALLLPMYPLIRYTPSDWFRSVWVQLGLLFVSLVVMRIGVVQGLFSRMDVFLQLTGYEVYTQTAQADNVETTVTLGVGFFITLLMIVLIIVSSRRMKDYLQSPLITTFYNIFFVGVMMKYVFISSNLFGRINYYFISMMFIVLAATLRYAHRNDRRLFYALMALSVLSFLAVVVKGQDNTADFVFFFQDDLHYLKHQL